MPQIAQQDYIVINIADISALTDAEKAVIREKVASGVIFDCIIHYDVYYYRPLCYDIEASELYVADSIITTIDYSE